MSLHLVAGEVVQSYLLNAYGLLGKSDQYDSWQFQQSIYDACLVDPLLCLTVPPCSVRYVNSRCSLH